MEIELKLLVNSQGAQVMCQHLLLKKYAIAKSNEQKTSHTYFDTPDLQIRRSDAGLRVRRVNSIWVQTLKGGGGVNGGLHSRHEWESQVTGPAPDLAGLRDMGAQVRMGQITALSKGRGEVDANFYHAYKEKGVGVTSAARRRSRVCAEHRQY